MTRTGTLVVLRHGRRGVDGMRSCNDISYIENLADGAMWHMYRTLEYRTS